MSTRFAPGTVIEEVALFPLPEVVLFPGTLLPLHIFEPRYRKMTEDVLAGSKLIVPVLVPDPGAVDRRGNPVVVDVAGLGEIVQHRRHSDGRFDLILVGRARVLLTELPFVHPYRRARAEVLACSHGDGANVTGLVSSATRFATRVREVDDRLKFEVPTDLSPGLLCDACAHALVIDGDERQSVLEALDVRERIRRCSEYLAVQEALLGRSSDIKNLN